MDTGPLGRRYFEWLCSQVVYTKSRARARTHRSLLWQLYQKEFVWFIPNDDNRVEDGREMRYEYLAEHPHEQGNSYWTALPCSMLELLIVLSRRLGFQTDDEPHYWFWHLLEMMDIRRFNDKEYDDNAEELVEEACDRVIWRTYSPSGEGGLFPLRRPEEDQREVELWYQLNAYLLELYC